MNNDNVNEPSLDAISNFTRELLKLFHKYKSIEKEKKLS